MYNDLSQHSIHYYTKFLNFMNGISPKNVLNKEKIIFYQHNIAQYRTASTQLRWGRLL